MINKIYDFINKHSLIVVIIVYLLVNIFFNTPIFWGELFNDSSRYSAVIGEINATEWGMEQIYRRLTHLENPFKPLDAIFYPFSIDMSGADIGFAFHFLYLRPFLSPHQSLSLLIILNFFLANICMYALLRKIGLRKIVSFLIGLAFGYITFMTVRLGHLTYSMYYVFPLFLLSCLYFITAKDVRHKLVFTLSTSLIFIFILWSHIYYFIFLLISAVTLCIYYLLFYPKESLQFVKKSYPYLILGIVSICILLIPWFIGLRESSFFSQTPQSIGWGGAIGFSSDLLGYFIPSGYNYYYGKFVDLVIQKFDISFARGIFENFTYPGIIIFAGYGFLVYLLLRKKLTNKTWNSIKGYLIASLTFWVLTLGPFLHIAGRWALTLDDEIKVVVPLPYILLHYIPLLSNIRSPGRFIVGFIFFAYIVVAFLLADLLKNKSKKFITITSLIFIAIFIIDHRYPNEKLTVPFYFPHQIYKTIARDTSQSTVMEIPFTVRDGITYFGDEGAIYQIMGQFVFIKPILGGYSGRVPDYIKDYYTNNAFTGYVGRFIDSNVNFNGSIDRNNLDSWQVMDEREAERSIDFLDLKHIVMNTDKPYAATLAAQLTNIGFSERIVDKNYLLLERPISSEEFLTIDMGRKSSSLQLGMGWSQPYEKSYRWTGKKFSVLFKISDPQKYKLVMKTASFFKKNELTVYVNKKMIGELTIEPNVDTYTLSIPFELKRGINMINFIYKDGYIPSEVINGSKEKREFSAKVYTLKLMP